MQNTLFSHKLHWEGPERCWRAGEAIPVEDSPTLEGKVGRRCGAKASRKPVQEEDT